MRASPLDLWPVALNFLPEDLDELARGTGALIRPRKAESAEQLLRLFLLYASTNSFKTAAALGRGSGLMDITSEGLFYRLRNADAFLEAVLSYLVGLNTSAPVGRRLLIVDATSISGPRSSGTDFRFHVGYDPVKATPCTFHLSDSKVGENFALHDLKPGQLVLGDRGYGTAKNIDAALNKGADVLIRVQRGGIRLFQEADGLQRVDWSQLEREVPETGAVSWWVAMPVPFAGHRPRTPWRTSKTSTWRRIRIVAIRNTRGEIIWLATNLPEAALSDSEACELYRVRWQVELYFKRLKSIGDLDVQLSRDGPTARAGLLAKLILLVLTSLLQNQEQEFSPYGYPIRQKRQEPVARIRLRSEAAHGGSHAPRSRSKTPPKKCAHLEAQACNVLA